jgi:hypothetical protein
MAYTWQSSNGTSTSHGLYKLEIVVIVDSRMLDLYSLLFNKSYSVQFSTTTTNETEKRTNAVAYF